MFYMHHDRADADISTPIALGGALLLMFAFAGPDVVGASFAGPVVGLTGLALLTWAILLFGARTRPE